MYFAAHLLVLVGRHRFLLMPVAFVLAFALAGAIRRWTNRRPLWAFLLIPLGVLNVLLSPDVCAWMLYRVGQTAPAQVTGTYATSTSYNNHDVVGYDALIQIAADAVVAVQFEDDAFNIYPAAEGFIYPRPGYVFNVRFLPGFARDFVIVSNDDSPWAVHLRCGLLGNRLIETKRRFTFAHGAVAFRADYVAAISAYVAQDCAKGAEDAEAYRQDIARANAGVVDPAP